MIGNKGIFNQIIKNKTLIEVALIRAFVVVVQLVFLKLYTNYTSLYELGIFYFLFTISYSLNAFLFVPLDYFQQSQLHKLINKNYSIKSFKYIYFILLKFNVLLLIISITLCFFINKSYCLIAPMVIGIAFFSYNVNLLRGFLNNLGHKRFAVYTLLFESFLKIFFFAGFIYFYKSNSIVILISFFFSSLAVLLLLYYLVVNLEQYKQSDNVYKFNFKEILTFSYPISFGAVINWIQLQGYRVILVPLGYVELVGIYSTVANVGASGMNAYSTVFSQLFVPNIYKTNGSFIFKYMKYAFVSIILVLSISFFLSDFITAILTKKDFIKYSLLITYGVLSEAGNFLTGALTIFLTIHNCTKYSISVSIIGLIIFVGCIALLFFSNEFNVYTIGVPIVISQLSVSFCLYFIVKKINKKFNTIVYER